MALTATTDSSSQTTTGSPQTAAGSSGVASADSGGVQPGTATSLLYSQTGIQLHGTALTNVSLSPGIATTTTVQSSQPKLSPKHSVNTPMLGVSAVFIVIAVASFFVARRSVKSTT